MKQSTRNVISPLVGGMAGTVLQRLVTSKLARRGGGIKGMLLGAAATFLVNRYVTGRPVAVRSQTSRRRSHSSHNH